MNEEVKLTPFEIQSLTKQVHGEIPKGIQMIQAPLYWDKGKRGKGIKIAVLDTGCDINHPDLKDRIVGGKNFTPEDGGVSEKFDDYNGHGTHVAGTIAASMNGQGVIGVAPEASLLILKVLDSKATGKNKWVTDAIYYAIEQKVHIISMSLRSKSKDENIHEAIKQAVNSNILVVCAAGNGGTNEYRYPAGFNEVISVGVVDLKGKATHIQSTNNEVDLVAPGVEILSSFPTKLSDKDNPYRRLSGTSMATPHAAGALALLINWCEEQFKRQLTEPELYAQLVKRTIPLGYEKEYEGNGLLYLASTEKLEDFLKQNPIHLEQYR